MTTKNTAGLFRSRVAMHQVLGANSDLRVHLSCQIDDPDWDSFVAKTRDGSHLQSSAWGQLKVLVGWRRVRVALLRDGQIVAGAQLLLRSLPLAGSIGYVPRGPLLGVDDPEIADLVLKETLRVARERAVRYLAVVPPMSFAPYAHQLERHGLRANGLGLDMVPIATAIIDLGQDLDGILGRMNSKTRYNLRLGTRKEVTVREGSESDLDTFYDLLLLTGQRKEFASYSRQYFHSIWRILAPHGQLKLFLAECGGEVVSGLLAIAFGSTVTYWRGAWSGRRGDCHPNEAMQWAAIQWAKSNGYQYYDFEGIDLEVARAIARGESVQARSERNVTSFKLAFGGDVVLFPGIFDYVPNPILRWAHTEVLSRIATESAINRIRNTVRGVTGH